MIIADLEYMTELSNSSSTVGGSRKEIAFFKNVAVLQKNNNATLQVAVLNKNSYQSNYTYQGNNIEIN